MTPNDPITFGSVCSGIEAASVAWHSLDWRAAWLAEVDVAASQVLAYRLGATAPVFPMAGTEKQIQKATWGTSLTNWGDMTRVAEMVRCGEAEAPDILCGGTPCQSFSVAGARRGLEDARGNLALSFIQLADAIDERRAAEGKEPCIVIFENVPGLLSSNDNAFGCFLGALSGEVLPLVPSGKRWTNAGVVLGPERAVAWRVGDAQYFGLAQRRRRVFVVASAREGFDPAAILLEFDGVRRDSAPRREAGEGVAGTLDEGADGGGRGFIPSSFGAYRSSSSSTLRAAVGDHGGGTEAIVITLQDPLLDVLGLPGGELGIESAAVGNPDLRVVQSRSETGRRSDYPHGLADGGLIDTHTPTWWDGSPVSQTLDAVLHKGQTMPEKNRFPAVLQPVVSVALRGREGGATVELGTQDPDVAVGLAHTLGRNSGQENAVCVTGSVTHTLRAEGFDASEDGTGRGQPIVAIDMRQASRGATMTNNRKQGSSGGAPGTGIGKPGEPSPTVSTSHTPAVFSNMAVRRLMPVECERLQGFPDGWTLVPVGKTKGGEVKWAADGPRYKQLGNSWAVDHAHWVGARVDAWIRANRRAPAIEATYDPALMTWLTAA